MSGHTVEEAVNHAAHLLPVQGPIGVFIHHNTLHSFQHLTFEEAVVKAAEIFGAEPYMRETAYRADLAVGRILPEDIDWVLRREPNAAILPGRLDRLLLRRAMLAAGMRPIDALSAGYLLDEGDWLTKLRHDLDPVTREQLTAGHRDEAAAARAIFEICLERIDQPAARQRPARRPQEGILWSGGPDLDEAVHPLLIRLCAVFLDQGMAYWPMPWRERGFYGAARDLLAQPGAIYPHLLRGLGEEFARQRAAKLDAETVVRRALARMGLHEAQWEAYLGAELLALPGWAGLIRKLEEEPDLAPHETLTCSLMDFLAVRLTLTLTALDGLGADARAWSTVTARQGEGSAARRLAAARLMDAAQLCGLAARDLTELDDGAFASFAEEAAAFDDLERRRLWHQAYERRHELLILGPMARYRRDHPPQPPAQSPAAQVFFCIDEREESIRRALEECDPDVETLAAAGFFGVAVDYKGIDDAHGVALCPVVVKPQHTVTEVARAGHEESHEIRVNRRRRWAGFARGLFVGSRSLLRGWVSTAVLGTLSLIPLLARVLSPLQFARLRKKMNELFLPEPRTELAFMRDDTKSHDAAEGLARGFTVDEKASRVGGVLGSAGLTRGFAPIVVVLGHGSTSLNNPHESAHDCGACGGRRGGPNGRLFAAMANHPGVRIKLRERGIDIPDTTWFVGGYHDTCSDDIDLYDTDLIPASLAAPFDRIRRSLDKARAASALERARRFVAAEDAYSTAEALLHMEERSEHLAEPRPEYGHCTNAVCVVGRRSVTRGLFMDRRAFLVSYDAAGDPENAYLAGLLGAVFPVCGGISLEYYFSFVDNERYGCGTKLPHNVTGLIGVMNGHASDLRTGLPWQMVEIHEPVRILFVIETTPERLAGVIAKSPALIEFVENRWLRVATMDPATGEIEVYRGGGRFERAEPSAEPLPRAKSSVAFFRGKMQHLPLAEIGA